MVVARYRKKGALKTLIATVPTASIKNPRAYSREKSEPEPKASQKIEITGGMKRSPKLMMPSFSILHQRLPPPLKSTGTIYTHLTVNSYGEDRSKMDNPPEETNLKSQ